MSQSVINMTLLFVLVAIYLPVIVSVYRQHEGQETAATLLSVYAFIAMLLGIGDGLLRGGVWQMQAPAANDLMLYGAFVLAVVMALTALAFTRQDLSTWLGIAVFWGIVIALIIPNILGLGEVIWTNGAATLTRDRLAPAWAALGWFVFTVGALVAVRSAYSRSRQPLLRNRLNYWTPVFIFIFINEILLIVGRQIPGNPLRLFAAAMAAFIIVTHDPPDLRQVARRLFTYIITTIVIVGIYIAGYLAAQALFGTMSNFNPLVVGASIAVVLSFIFSPLLTFVRRLVSRWLSLEEIQATKTLHAYSQQISNILDMQKLANVAVGLIIESMGITRGFLFLVDTDRSGNGTKSYSIRAVRNPGERQIKVVSLGEESPIVKHFLQDQRPLLQYDFDLLPAYRPVSTPDRQWFQALEAEVYLPIYSKREWIGMLALGAKINGNRYTEEDLVTLSTLANQTAVALENARLVENLNQTNTELRVAYRNLDGAKRDLERLDQTKSDFISIASHELRTPLTTMIGYTEMLIEDKALPETATLMLKGISKGTKRLHEIIDSMFDIAQIDARTLQLHLTPVDINIIIKDVAVRLEKTIKERNQMLSMELPQLPMIKADPNLLEKLFQHLLTNAIKFTPNNGKIRITAKPSTIQNADFPNGGIEIIVSDTGVGVDPHARDIIFSKFYQPGELAKHSTGKTKFKGSGAGLGLALSKGIVEVHGGSIWVESEGYDEEKFPGSQFHAAFPLRLDKGEEIVLGIEVKTQVS
ncbi:MAG TPA: GAF domain-containing sensor histidine kinase [Anaerolineales bacterium]|nr:GAF domain-containing sensor histidine kinase [Anaerolineales bacterium]